MVASHGWKQTRHGLTVLIIQFGPICPRGGHLDEKLRTTVDLERIHELKKVLSIDTKERENCERNKHASEFLNFQISLATDS